MAQNARAVLSLKEQEVSALRQEALNDLEAQVRVDQRPTCTPAAAPAGHPHPSAWRLQLAGKDAELQDLRSKVSRHRQ